jgi:hypothetical protein
MNSLIIYSVLLILCNFVPHLCLSVLTWLHIAICSVLDEFRIQSHLCGCWIGECIWVCMYVCMYVPAPDDRRLWDTDEMITGRGKLKYGPWKILVWVPLLSITNPTWTALVSNLIQLPLPPSQNLATCVQMWRALNCAVSRHYKLSLPVAHTHR